MPRSLALLVLALPIAALAQAPAAAAPAPKQGVVVEWGGWFQTPAGRTVAAPTPPAPATPALPLYAPPPGTDTAGISARQSRLRAGVTLPTDGLLGGAKLKGLVEIDF